MTLRDLLLAKRANYLHSVAECQIRVLQAEEAVRQAKQSRRMMREALAQAKGGLQVVEETIAAIDKPAPEAPVKPASTPA